ncbi:MAG: hypothetical protein ACYDEE_03830 [Ignavibacteriaceae bacterium]
MKYRKIFVVLFLFTSLQAYDFIGIPIEWVGQILIIIFYILFIPNKFEEYRFLKPLIIISLIGACINIYYYLNGYFINIYPANSTTSYPIFIILRYINIISFISVFGITRYLISINNGEELKKNISIIAFYITIYSLYVYFAQIFNLPEFPRTRIDTAGNFINKIHFTYNFHRAIGTFREPSHLAEWLILPLSLSFSLKAKDLKIIIALFIILLLTGSLTGIISIFISALIVFLFFSKKIKFNFKFKYFLIFFILIISVNFFLSDIGKGIGLIGTIIDRISPILSKGGGIEATNRAYVYNFISMSHLPLIGYGFGNGNILFSNFLGISEVASFLSLYLNILFSTGILGLIILLFFLIKPLFIPEKEYNIVTEDKIYLLIGYISQLIAFFVNSEELTINFGILLAFILITKNYRGSYKNSDY